MVPKSKTRIAPDNEMDSKRLLSKLKKTSNLADKALKHYGVPTISLDELRNELSQQLQCISLSNIILKDREAGR